MSNTTKTQSYLDPRWQKKRLQVFERDGFKCVACGDVTSPLHAHHISYNGQPWETPIDEIQTLCEDCHSSLPKHPKGGVFFGFESVELCNNEVFQFLAFRHCPVCGETKHDCHSGCVLFTCGHIHATDIPEKFKDYFQHQDDIGNGWPAYFFCGNMYNMKDDAIEKLESCVNDENEWSESQLKEMADTEEERGRK